MRPADWEKKMKITHYEHSLNCNLNSMCCCKKYTKLRNRKELAECSSVCYLVEFLLSGPFYNSQEREFNL